MGDRSHHASVSIQSHKKGSSTAMFSFLEHATDVAIAEHSEIKLDVFGHTANTVAESVWRRDTKMNWIPTTERLPEVYKPVIGFADRWVHQDYNEMGMRECFRNDDEWQSAAWNNYQDCYYIEVGPP